MKTRVFPRLTTLIVASLLAGSALADTRDKQGSKRQEKAKEVTVFVTGSLIPQRVRLQPVGTNTVSPVRIIDRREIDGTGRFTTAGALINDPSVRIVGFGH